MKWGHGELEFIQGVDNRILIYIMNHMYGEPLNQIMKVITTLGNYGVVWIGIAMLLLTNKKYRKTGILVLFALIISTLVGDLAIKYLVQRPRPMTLPQGGLLIDRPLSYSFPSGHAMSSFACACVLAIRLGRKAWGFYILAASIAFSRVYLQVHNSSDVIAGMVFGILTGIFTIKYISKHVHLEG